MGLCVGRDGREETGEQEEKSSPFPLPTMAV